MRLRVHDTQLVWKWSLICSQIESRAMSWWSAHDLPVVVWCGSAHQVMLLFLKVLHLELVIAHILLFCSEWVHLVHLLLVEHLIFVYVVSLALATYTDRSALNWNEVERFIPHLLRVCRQVYIGVAVLCVNILGCILDMRLLISVL